MKAAVMRLPTAVLPRRLAILLRQAWAGLNKGFRDRIEHLGITPFQFSILRWLGEGPVEGLLQWELVDLMSSDPNTVSSGLSRMVKLHFIKRLPHREDGRASRIQLCPEGMVKFQLAAPIARAFQEEILSAVPAARRERFLADLEAIAGACSGALNVGPCTSRKAIS